MDIAKSKPAVDSAVLREAESVSVGFQRVVEQLAKQVGAHSHASSVFGEPVKRDGVTVIPVARVIAAFGAGAGGGANDQHNTSERGGQGFGGGGGYIVTPVGVIEVREEGARFVPMDSAAGPWGDLTDLLLFAARRGLSRLARAIRKA